MNKEFEYYTWEDFETDVTNFIIELKKKNGKYNSILAIPRGGLPLGVRLSHELKIPLILGGARGDTLVVDDICDTGNTVLPFIHKCDILTIFRKKDSPIFPTYWARENEQYIVFPWEKQ